MYKRLTLSLAMLAIGAAMLAASGIASTGSAHKQSSPQAKKGGILKASLFAGIENIDPQRSYYVPESQYEWLTQRPLLNFAHAEGARGYRLLNEGASSYTVSPNGQTYTFHVRHGMRFSDGSAVTSANYKHTLLRILNPNVGSPIASFLTDPASVNIRGAIAYNTTGNGSVSGIVTPNKYTLVLKLVKANALLPTLMAMIETGATPTSFPMKPITSPKNVVSAGKYYVSSYTPDRSISVRLNKFYKPAGAVPYPGNVSGIDYSIGIQQDQALLLTKQGKLDWPADGLSSTAWGPLFAQYGTKGRARVFATSVVDYVTMNNSKGVFANATARKAVEYGINRKSLVKIRGPRAGSPQCSMLTPAIPGYKKCSLYPLGKQDLAKARSLAQGHTGHINYWYTASTLGTQIQHLAASQLNAIGFNNIDTKPFQSGLFTALGKKGNDYDFAIVGWQADFPDPYDYINKLLSGDTIQDVQNNNTAYFNNPTANKLMRSAAQLRGAKRFSTYGNLDNQIQKTWSPTAPIDNRNDREFFSSRVDTSTVKTSPVYEIDLGRIALK
ncbi:MAG TPA: ABC transporter substrate-binding protein [Gaiellaceae bacterium]|nr:ABC transporter substrate-binding protein [Gaiellaceae bacterium]